MAVKEKSGVFTVQVPLRWADMDAYGHINNVTMFRILEEARIAVLGCPPSSGEPTSQSLQPPLHLFADLPANTQALVAENHAKYRAPLPYRGQSATVEVYISKVAAASLRLCYEVYDTATGTHCVSASTVLAFFNTATGSLVRLSKEQRARLTTYQATK